MNKITLKSRSAGITTSQEIKQALIGNDPAEKHENPMELAQQIQFYTRSQASAKDRNTRLMELMQRPCAKRWAAAKKQKMVRRFTETTQVLQECDNALDLLTNRLSTLLKVTQSDLAEGLKKLAVT